jgi:membrane-associated phospholipid phosphatase
MISLDSWWWPTRPIRVPGARTAGLLAGLGAAAFGVSALLVKIGAVGWDLSLFRILNQVPAAAASVLTPLSHLFLPAGILVVVVLTIVYVVARNHSVLPVAAGGLAAGIAWLLANAAKAVADRPRPYEVMANTVLRQQPAHGTSFPSSHTAVTLAVVIALVPFLARPLAAVGIGYAVLIGWSRVYLGVHYPLDVLAGAGIGMAVGGVILLGLGMLRGADRAVNFRNAATERRPPRPAPERPPRDAASCRRHRAGRADRRGVCGRAGAPRWAVLAGTVRVACWWIHRLVGGFAFFKVPFSPQASVSGRAWSARA